MRLTPGDHLGPYEILSPLGAGGMGEVYRARDTKLNRDVAIKVLPAGLANDADYLARFQREAQALAALHHPNIATIFGLELNAIVMELIEGQNPKGPLPLNEALNIARQMAEALEAAHDKGIIHRDLKPGNVIVTPEGVVKVLDFGLAKTAEKSAGPTTADSPTLTMRATEAGLILGTAGYMSPEQAAGKPVDRRADIWSFGVVLHELLTGKRLFDGETVSHTLAHVLTADVDLSKVPAGPIRDLLRRCLDRNLKTRLRDIGEARIAIESYLAHPPTETKAPIQSSRWPWIAAAVFALAAIAMAALHSSEAKPVLPVVTTTLLAPEGAEYDFTAPYGMPALSPDGTRLVYAAKGKDGKTQLWLRRLDSAGAQPLANTENAATPFWSPDSQWIAFGQEKKLKKIDLQGAVPFTITDIPDALRGGSWNTAGVIVFGTSYSDPILQVAASGGKATPVTEHQKGPDVHRHPWFLPDGRHFLYNNGRVAGTTVLVGSLDEPDKPGKMVAESSGPAVYAQGYLLYLRDDTLMAQPFDATRLATTGEAVQLAEGIPTYTTSSRIGAFAASPGGLLVSTEFLCRSRWAPIRALQDTVFQAQQNYMIYPQFGTVNYLSNFNHNTWHSGNISLEKRFGKGLLFTTSFHFSKSLSNDDSLSYYNRQGKARTSYDQQKAFGAFVVYELPVGKGQRWLNHGGALNTVLGGWKVNVSENTLSGQPISVTHSGSPNRYLTASRVNTLAPIEQAQVPNWDMGQRFPTAAQTPYFNSSVFAYPAAYTIGTLGSRVVQAPPLYWMQFFITKSWNPVGKA